MRKYFILGFLISCLCCFPELLLAKTIKNAPTKTLSPAIIKPVPRDYWGNPELVLSTSETIYSFQRAMKELNGVIHYAFMNYTTRDIRYMRKVGNDLWASPVIISLPNQLSQNPAITVYGTFVGVVYNSWGSSIPYFTYSKDEGKSWTQPVQVAGSDSMVGDVAMDGNIIYVVIQRTESGVGHIDIHISHDFGQSWTVVPDLSPQAGWTPQIAVDNGFIHIVWNDGQPNNSHIWYRQGSKKGSEWSEPVRLSNASGFGQWPTIAAKNDKVYAIWVDYQNTPPPSDTGDVFYVRSDDYGKSWTYPQSITTEHRAQPGTQEIAINPNNPNNISIVWADNRRFDPFGNDNDIYYIESKDKGNSWANLTNLTPNGFATNHHGGSNVYMRPGETGVIFNEDTHKIWHKKRIRPQDNPVQLK